MSDYLYPNYGQNRLVFSYGKGSFLYTEAGEEYLDFTAGIAVNCLGHSHPYLIEKLGEQAQKLWHTSNLFTNKLNQSLAKRLCDLSFANRVFFCNSGTEAVECAIKTARHYHYTKGNETKTVILSFTGAFHGRTLGSLAATGRKKYLEGFGKIAPDFVQININDSLEQIKQQLENLSKNLAAIILEPIQAEGGVNVIGQDLLILLREFCNQNNVLLIFDEIQTGIYRTGTLFAYQQTGIEPDILTLAKGLGGGFPIGACLSGKDIAEGMIPGTHGSTFGGNLLAMATAHAVLDLVTKEEIVANVIEQSKFLIEKLTILSEQHSNLIKKPRGKGLLIGIPVNAPAAELVAKCYQNKLLVAAADKNTIRLLPPLNISRAEAELAISKFEQALKA